LRSSFTIFTLGSPGSELSGGMNFSVIAAVFPLVFLGELPDKTMFASLVMATRGRPLAVWVGAAAAFLVHTVIAVAIGVALFHLLPHAAVEYFVAAVFAAGAVYSFLIRNAEEESADAQATSAVKVAVTAAGVIFVAEWGDLTQIIMANLAARYHDWLSVGLGGFAALLVVAALAVLSGSRLLGRLPVRTLRIITAAALAVLAAYTFVEAIRG
jgi:putative Ca2+/H+ antiporter (TMEM165/GDT1 family)